MIFSYVGDYGTESYAKQFRADEPARVTCLLHSSDAPLKEEVLVRSRCVFSLEQPHQSKTTLYY